MLPGGGGSRLLLCLVEDLIHRLSRLLDRLLHLLILFLERLVVPGVGVRLVGESELRLRVGEGRLSPGEVLVLLRFLRVLLRLLRDLLESFEAIL